MTKKTKVDARETISETFSAPTSEDAQPRAIGNAECGLVFDAQSLLQKTRNLIGAYDNRELARFMYGRQMLAEVGAIKHHPEEEPQCRDSGVDLWNAAPLDACN